MKPFPVVFVSVSLLAFAAGCGASAGAPSSSSSAADSVEAAHASSQLSGSYSSVGKDSLNLPYYSYTFKTDGTYTAAGGCPPLSGCFAMTAGSGTWNVTKNDGHYKVELVDQSGDDKTYFETWDGFQLTLSKTADGATSTFFSESWTKEIPNLDVCQDNNGNSLGECRDSGNYGCVSDGLPDNLNVCAPLD
jgi:hypothetical protein